MPTSHTLNELTSTAHPLPRENMGQKTCLRGFGNNRGADQPTHLRRLISAFVIPFLESIISKLATSEISIFLLVSVAEQAGLYFVFSETLKTGFVASGPICASP